jgi:hypothetical protein
MAQKNRPSKQRPGQHAGRTLRLSRGQVHHSSAGHRPDPLWLCGILLPTPISLNTHLNLRLEDPRTASCKARLGKQVRTLEIGLLQYSLAGTQSSTRHSYDCTLPLGRMGASRGCPKVTSLGRKVASAAPGLGEGSASKRSGKRWG